VLEEYEHAKARGATVYAEISGFGMSGDAYHITQPAEGGGGALRCMRHALDDAELNCDQIDYVNAHGTSTLIGDVAESQAIESLMGDSARDTAVSSTKSMTGHMLGAAGAAEAIFCILAIRDQVAPPTINLEQPAEGCHLDYVPNSAREMNSDSAVSNSYGIGCTKGNLVYTPLTCT